MFDTYKQGPTLQSKTRTGKTKFWYARVATEHYRSASGGLGDVFLIKTWWQEGGIRQNSTPKQIKGKNIGRANETKALEQALFDLQSLYKKRRDKGYSEDGSTDHIKTLPMLAHKWRDRKHNIIFPALIQPKLDGFRMLSDGKDAWTRGGQAHVPECVEHLIFDTHGVILDGELMLPGNVPLQQTSRAAKKFRPGVSDTLEWWVYDLVDPDMDFAFRSDVLLSILDPDDGTSVPVNVRVVPTYAVENEQELMDAHMEFLAQGYEGTMVRNRRGGYDVGNKSANLQKLKLFIDSEFLIVDIEEGEGSFEGLAIMVLQVGDETFKANPMGTHEYKAQLFQDREQHIGRWYTVRYQSLSEKGIPVGNTVGIDFRDKWTF